MLRFSEFRIREAEAAPATSPAPAAAAPTIPTPTPDKVADAAKMQSTVDAVGKVIDTWAKELKRSILNPNTPPEMQRGLWDRFKNWTANMWHGRYNQSNPYFWQNKLGDDLGREEESFNPSLNEYYQLRSIVDDLEYQINELSGPDNMPNLRIVRIIDQSAQELKKVLQGLISKEFQLPATSTAPTPAPISPEEKKPELAPKPKEEDDGPPVEKEKVPPTPKPLSTIAQKLLTILTQLRGGGKIDDKKAAALEALIRSGKDDETLKAQQAINDILNPTAAPTAPVAPEPEKLSLDAQRPKSDGRPWSKLSPEEQLAWNAYGGGVAQSLTGWLPKNGVKSLPWILRAGDPRHAILAKQPRQIWLPLLLSQKRIELSTEPIKSPEDLRKRIEIAKEKYNEWRDAMSKLRKGVHDRRKDGRTTAGDADAVADAAKQPLADPKPEIAPAVVPPNEAPTLAPTADAPQASAEMDTVPPNEKTGPGSGLSEPAHKPATAETDPDPVAPETAPEKGPPSHRKRKMDLKTRIAALAHIDEDTAKELNRRLKKTREGDEEGFKAIEDELAQHEEVGKLLASDGGAEDEEGRMDFAWTLPLSDTVAYYKYKLREQTAETYKPVVNRRKLSLMTWSERVEYLKDLSRKS